MNGVFVFVVVLIALLGLWAAVRKPSESSIEYRGERIKLSKPYSDYDDYKNDPGNIDPSETVRVQKLVSAAPIAGSFDTWEDAARAALSPSAPQGS